LNTKRQQKFGIALAGVASLWLAVSSQAATPVIGANVVENPSFSGQDANFQIDGGPTASDWQYSDLGFNLFSAQGDSYLVSQNLPTEDLYYYQIDFSLAQTPSEGDVDFAVDWNGALLTGPGGSPTTELSPSSSWDNFSFIGTAGAGSTSTLGFVGNEAFWSSVKDLDVYWTGGIDPPPHNGSVPDRQIGFIWETSLFLSLFGLAAFYPRQEMKLVLRKAAYSNERSR